MTLTYPAQIKITKTLPASSFYTGSGVTEIVYTADSITFNTKKALTNTKVAQSPYTQTSFKSDIQTSYITDLKRIDDNIKLQGYLADDDAETAWNKYWKLRAMCSAGNIDGDGGAVTKLEINNILFDASTTRAFLEEVTGTVAPSGGANNLSDNAGNGVARVSCSLTFVLGTPRGV